MRRSSHVLAPLLASTALGLATGCRSPEMQRCVDQNNHVVDSSLCRSGSYGGGGGGSGSLYRSYYGGSGSYRVGSTAEGGSTEPASGHSYSTTTGTERGGFGSSFAGDGGEGEGGGGGGGEGGGGE